MCSYVHHNNSHSKVFSKQVHDYVINYNNYDIVPEFWVLRLLTVGGDIWRGNVGCRESLMSIII